MTDTTVALSPEPSPRPVAPASVLGGQAAAVIGAALLSDMAVETIRSGSPVRWWVAGAAIAYIVVAALTWRTRWGWRARLGIAALFLMGVLAATVWRPEGLTNGVRLAGQSTAAVLSAATLAALVVAGFVLLRATVLPLAVRIVAALLTAYGIAAFGFGAWQATSYPALFAGASWWHAAPRWLQGAIVGGLVVLPLALLASLVGGLRRQQRTWRAQQIIALVLSIVMVVSGVTNTGVSYGSAASRASSAHSGPLATPLPAPPSAGKAPLTNEQVDEELNRTFRAVAAFSAAVPADTFDPAAVLAKTGKDPSAIFRWVRDETSWIPYAGVLRGAVGVLMDRKGNDLDRALLLAQLIRTGGGQARLARGTLPDAQAGDLLRTPRRKPLEQAQSLDLSPEVKALLDQYEKDSPAGAADVRTFANQLLERDARMEQQAGDRAATQAGAVAAILDLSAPKGGTSPRQVSALRDHWWVQVLQGSDWTDFDLNAAPSEPGRRLVDPAMTTAPEGLDQALYHEVEVRVITERWEQGRLEETAVLNHVLRPAELYGVDVSLSHLPIAWPQGIQAVSTADLRGQLKNTALNQHEWLPMLRVGNDLVFQFSFTDAGVKRTGRPGIGTTMERGLEGVAGLFGESQPSVNQSVLTAEWIEYEVRSPGQAPRKIRRELFDAIGPAQRVAGLSSAPTISESLHRELALTLAGRLRVLAVGCQLSREFVAHLFAQRFLANRAAILKLRAAKPATEEQLHPLLADITPMPSTLYSLALARWRWSRYRDDVYIDSPLVLTAHVRGRQDASGRMSELYSFDIVANDVSVWPDSGENPAAVRLEQGVLDTVAEAALAPDARRALEPPVVINNVSELYREAALQKIEWVPLRSINDPAWQKVQASPDVRARISQDLARGDVVVAPTRAVVLGGQPAFGWWRISPETGLSLGIDERGWGASMVEYAVILVDTVLCGEEFWDDFMKQEITAAFAMMVCALGFGSMFALAVGGTAIAYALALVVGLFVLANKAAKRAGG